MMTISEVLHVLRGVKPSKNGYSAQCPSHDDRHNSLSVCEKDGKVLWHCHAGCFSQQVFEALKIRRSSVGESELNGNIPSEARRIVAEYPYRDEKGKELFRSVRFEPKGFMQKRFEHGKPIFSLNGVRLVLFRLPELINSDSHRPVYIPEGEKDVEILRANNLVATCNPMGAGKWRDEYSAFLKNRVCFILPDNDDPGEKHAEAVARSITGFAKEVRIVKLPDAPEKGDVSDFLATNSIDDLKALAKNAPVYTPPVDGANSSERFSRLSPLQIIKLSDVKIEAVRWLWKPFLALGTFAILEGCEGEGKTFITLAIATATATGKGFPLMPAEEHLEPATVLLMTAEDSLAQTIKPRLEGMNAPCEKIIAINEPFTLDRDGILRLEMILAIYQPKLVVIDPLFSFTGKINLNNDNEIRSVTKELRRLAEKYQCVILGVRHIGKSKGMGDPRNAGLNGIGWRASARSVLLVGKDPENENERAIVQTKNNLGVRSDTGIGYKIESSQFFWTGESKLTAERMLMSARNEHDRAEQSEAMTLLHEILADGEREATEVEKEGEKLGLSARQIRTARNKLGVKWRREGFGQNSKIFLYMPDIDSRALLGAPIGDPQKENSHLLQESEDNKPMGNDLRIDDAFSNNENV